MKFGQYLKVLRKNKFTQKEFADILGVDHSYISKLENGKAGKPTDLTLYKISKILKIDTLELFYKAGKLSAKGLKTLKNHPELMESITSNMGYQNKSFDFDNVQKLSVLYQLPLASILLNIEDLLIADVNYAALELYQYDKDSLINQPFSILEFDNAVSYGSHDISKESEDTITINTIFTQHINRSRDIIPVKIITSPIFIKGKLYILKLVEKLDYVYFKNGSAQCCAIENARIFEYAPLATFLFVLKDKEASNFIYSNIAATELTGYSKTELLNLNPFILNLEKDKDIILGLFDVLKVEYKAFATTTIRSKDGSLNKCCVSATLNTINNNNYVYIVITEILE